MAGYCEGCTRLATRPSVSVPPVVALKPGLDLPQLDGARYETWPLADPAAWDIDGIRPLRDYIDTKVQQLLAELPPAYGAAARRLAAVRPRWTAQPGLPILEMTIVPKQVSNLAAGT